MTALNQEHEITIADFDLLSEWMALEPDEFGRQLKMLAKSERIKSAKTQQALTLTIQALEALYQKQRR